MEILFQHLRLTKHRLLVYTTLGGAALAALLCVLWARSYVTNHTFSRRGNGREVVVDCIRGEISLWVAHTTETAPTHYAHQVIDAEVGASALDVFLREPPRTEKWLFGFAYAEMDRVRSVTRSVIGPAWCVVIPIRFLALLAALPPLGAFAARLQRRRRERQADAACCRRCGAQMAIDDKRCPACEFPAFNRSSETA